jgi:hypothetical protein
VKDIELVLPPPRLTAKARQARQLAADRKAAQELAQKRESARLAALKAQQLAEEERARMIESKRQAAEAGDISVMEELSRRYRTGDEVPVNQAEAKAWHKKAVAAEAAAAKAELDQAREGKLAAMEGMASRYESGKGIAADPEKAQSWRDKAAAARTANEAQEQRESEERAAQARARAEEERRDRARQEAQRKTDAREAQRQAKLAAIDFFEHTSSNFEAAQAPNKNAPLTLTTAVVLCVPLGLATDLVTTPFKFSQMQIIQHEAALRPASWGKPDSMIAKAAALQRQKKIPSPGEQPRQVAAL